jgi:hypothetical protein
LNFSFLILVSHSLFRFKILLIRNYFQGNELSVVSIVLFGLIFFWVEICG